MFSASSIVGLTARSYHKKIPTNSWTVYASFGFCVEELSVGCAIWGAVDPYCVDVHCCGEYYGLVGVGC